MIFFCKRDGTLIPYVTESLNQGNINPSDVVLLAPFGEETTVTAAFTLPNGLRANPVLARLALSLGIKDENGITVNAWRVSPDLNFTAISGTLRLQFFFSAGRRTIASTMATFTVGAGVRFLDPEVEAADLESMNAWLTAAQTAALEAKQFTATAISEAQGWATGERFNVQKQEDEVAVTDEGLFLSATKYMLGLHRFLRLEGEWTYSNPESGGASYTVIDLDSYGVNPGSLTEFEVLTELVEDTDETKPWYQNNAKWIAEHILVETENIADGAVTESKLDPDFLSLLYGAINSSGHSVLLTRNTSNNTVTVALRDADGTTISSSTVEIPLPDTSVFAKSIYSQLTDDGTLKNLLIKLLGDNDAVLSEVELELPIPSEADADNPLATRDFVNSSVQTATANFRGNWSNFSSVPSNSSGYPADYAGSKVPTVNDYMVVQDASDFPVPEGEDDLVGTWRFKYSGVWATYGKGGWIPEYQVNETPLTDAQLNALNSGITAQIVGSIAGKLDERTGNLVVYINDANGNPNSAHYSQAVTGNTFALRDSRGALATADAVNDDDAVSLGQMNTSLATKTIRKIISETAETTPKGVTWWAGSTTQITGTLEASAETELTICFVPTNYTPSHDDHISGDYAEYVVVKWGNEYRWEKVGVDKSDLTDYAPKSYVDSLIGDINTALDAINGEEI